MGFDRFGAKLSARESLRANRPSPILVTLVYFLLTLGLSLVVVFLTCGPLVDLFQYLSTGYLPEEAIHYVLRDHGTSLSIFGVAWLLLGLYSTFMSFGYTSYTLRLARNEQPRFRHLFDGFARPLRVFGTSFLVSLFTLLWCLAILLPLGILLALGNIAAEDSRYIISNVSSAVSMVVAYRYSMTYYFLLDDPTCTARQAIRRSKTVMRGRKWSLFLLDISFIGWEVLSIMVGVLFSLTALYATLFLYWNTMTSIVAGVIGALIGAMLIQIWVVPYQQAARANFYDSVTGTDQPDGSPAGPDYDSPASDGTQPF